MYKPNKVAKSDVFLLWILAIAFVGIVATFAFGDFEVIVRALGSDYVKYYYWSSAVATYILIAVIVPNDSSRDQIASIVISLLFGWLAWPILLWKYLRGGLAG